ncbi:hypothetical protein AB6A40_006233 [Gnathostoma spinigerum]|uniref:Uncharacterized protein n=1 Tax=Gnathostoma spinigerum TaxID=75299 RepID=A0ABD6EMZ4_9BILA
MWNSIVAWSRRMSHLASCLRPVLKESLKGAGASRSIALTAFVTIFSSLGYDVLDADLLDELRNLRKWNGSSSELLAALLILLNSDQVEDKNNIHQSACTMDVFYKDKFISSLRESDAVLLTALCEKLIVDRPFNESEKHSYAEVAIRSLFIPLYWPNHQLRNRALAALKRIVAAEGVPFCAVFLNRLCEAIGSGQLDQTYKTIASVQQTTVEGKAPCIPGHSILPSVNACLISFDLADESSTNLSNFISSALLVCCNPRIAEIDSSKWLRWLSQVKRYEELLKMDDSLVKSVVTSVFKSEDSSVRLNAIGLLMSSNHVALPFRHEIWSYCENLMSRIKVESFTNIMERDIAIFNTPDGVLYNTDVIDQNSDEALQEKNVKRESKVYKYKEQVFEMQLRKELAEKRRNEGRLTERQKKAVEAEIQSERVVRDQLRGMYNDCAGRLDALSIVVHGNPSGSTEHIDLLLSVVIPLLKSRLVTRPAFECFRSFRDAAFEPSDDYLHELVLHSSARVLGSAYCDKAWSEEAVSTQLERTIGLLLARCVLIPSMENGCAEDEESIDGGLDGDDERMNVHKLAFMIPMLNSVLRDSSQSYALRFNSIQLLSSALSESFINVRYQIILIWIFSNLHYINIHPAFCDHEAHISHICAGRL